MLAQIPSGTVDGVNAVFTLAQDSDGMLFVDRVCQIEGVDYTRNGVTLTFNTGAIPQTGSTIRWFPLSGGSTFFDSAGDIINDAAIELGLISTDLADPFASTDANIQQLCRLLKKCGRELVRDYQWTWLQRGCKFTTVQGQSTYPLPADFRMMLNQTGWNRTNRLPLGGPLSPQEWEFLKARLAGVVFTVLFRPVNRQILLYPDQNTPGGYEIAFEYMCSSWVSSPADSGPTRSAPIASSDVIYLDPQLVMLRLKVAFLEAKGFDSSSAQNEFGLALEQAMGDDGASPILRLDGRLHLVDKLLDSGSNTPITGFGQ